MAAIPFSISSFTLALSELDGDADRILDGVGVRRSMRDDAHAFHSQQRRAAVLGVIEALLEVGEGAARKQIARPVA